MGKRRSKRKNGNGSARKAARGFEFPGFFEGLDFDMGSGLDTGQQLLGGNQGTFLDSLEIPELGEGFNDRFGQVGGGFIEEVQTFDIGVTPGRVGDIRSGGTSKLERAARREGKQPGRASRAKPPSDAKTTSAAQATATGISKGAKKIFRRLRGKKNGNGNGNGQSRFTERELALEKQTDASQRARFQEALEQERRRTGIRGSVDEEGRGAL